MAQRELKFRAWGTHNGHSDGIMLFENDGSGNIEDGILNLHTMRIHYADTKWTAGSGEWVEYPIIAEDETTVVMQFTGLKDKNGKEIYEGDLLRFPAKSEWEKDNYTAYEVFFHDNDANSDYNVGYSINRTHNFGAVCGGYIPSFKPKTTLMMEIIGNIYENPELLK